MRRIAVAGLLVVAIVVAGGAEYLTGAASHRTVTTGSSQTSLGTTFITHFDYQISVRYTGSWNLIYWGTNGTVTSYNYTQYNVRGDVNGSGNFEKTVTTYGVGYVENTLCAKATKLDSQNHTLTLEVVGKSNSTNASNPMAEVCVTFAV